MQRTVEAGLARLALERSVRSGLNLATCGSPVAVAYVESARGGYGGRVLGNLGLGVSGGCKGGMGVVY